MVSVPTFQSNPFGSFDPSQWSNQFSKFQNAALPWPTQYAGLPTDAMGQPIQQQPGMTLNSQPQAAPAAAAAAPSNNTGTLDLINTLMANARGAPQQSWGNNQSGTGQGTLLNELMLQKRALQQQQPATAAAAPASTPNPAGPTTQQYLSLLANPGAVQTPGATVPQATGVQPGSGVLQQFLANWRPAQSGPGSGFQQGFLRALGGGR